MSSIRKYFMVGETFRHMYKGTDIPQYHGQKFAAFIKRIFGKQILLDFSSLRPLLEYISAKKMTDTQMVEETDSQPLRENQFLMILYALIIEPKLGKLAFGLSIKPDIYYFFHVILDSGEKVVFDIIIDKKRCSLSMDEFDNDHMFCKSFIFIYPSMKGRL